jgi:heme-degrading monooxygenase HmoA
MPVARVATFEAPVLHVDDERRSRTLQELLRSLPGFIAGYHLRDERTGRMISLTLWDGDLELEAGEAAVRNRPLADQRGIRPTRVERWAIDASF